MSNLDKAEEQLNKDLKGTGATVSRKKVNMFTDDQAKRIAEARKALRGPVLGK